MKTTWFKVLDERLGFTPNADKWLFNTTLADTHKISIQCVLKNPTYGTSKYRASVFELLEWLEANKFVEPARTEWLYGLDDWIKTFPVISVERTEGDYERHAGNGIPFINTKYQVYDRVFEIQSYPCWDNYQEDYSIYMGDVLVSIYQG